MKDTTPPKAVILINAASGALHGHKLYEYVQAHAQPDSAVLKLDWSRIEEQLALAKSAGRVVIGGGDGTFSSLLPHFLGSDVKISLLPLGTGNDLARDLAKKRCPVPLKWLEDMKVCPDSLLSKLAVWQIRESETGCHLSYFVNYLSFGFSAKVVSSFAALRSASRRVGKLAQRFRYAVIGAKNFFQKVPDGICVSRSAHGTPPVSAGNNACLIFSNISSWIGLARIQKSDPSDSFLEATFAKSPVSTARMIAAWHFPALALPPIGSSPEWLVTGITSGECINRDGEADKINANSIRISCAGFVNIEHVVKSVPPLLSEVR